MLNTSNTTKKKLLREYENMAMTCYFQKLETKKKHVLIKFQFSAIELNMTCVTAKKVHSMRILLDFFCKMTTMLCDVYGTKL